MSVEEWDRLISSNEIFLKRLAGLAVIPGPMAIDYGLVGPNLRASGVPCSGAEMVIKNLKSLNGTWLRITQATLDVSCQFQLGEQRFLLKVL